MSISLDGIVEQVGIDDILNGRFIEQEINRSIKQLKNNKTVNELLYQQLGFCFHSVLNY